MKLDPARWRELSALLDEALDLDAPARTAWLASLAATHADLQSLLVELLGADARARTADFIDTLPAFEPPGHDAGAGAAPGALVGPYRLVRELGRGGMGEVWLAERADGVLRRPVALKLPLLALARGVLAERFARERAVLASLAHPNIARLYDAGFAADGQPYLALEYVDGVPITAYADAQRLDVDARLALFDQVLRAVAYAHANLVLHRDLKPSNILVTPQGEVKLLDFGIAKLLTDGAAAETALTRLAGHTLTPDYAAPEQITRAPLTTATDVYALGVVLYELLAGRRPYHLKRGTPAELEEAIVTVEPLPPSRADLGDAVADARGTTLRRLRRTLEGDLDTIVAKALEKRVDQRYATVAALADDLARRRDRLPIVARPASTWYRVSRFVRRNALAVSTGAIVMLALLIGAGVALWQARIATEQSVRAAASTDFVVRLFQSAGRSNPGGAAAGDTTARRLLQVGSDELLQHAGGDPRLELDLSLLLSRLNVELDLIEPAAALGERAVALARTIDGGDGTHVGAALLAQAETYFRAARYTDAIRTAEDALGSAERRGDDAQRAQAHLLIGASQHQLDYARSEGAQQHLETALALLKRTRARSEDVSRASYYLAFIAELRLDHPRAEALYREGIEAGIANFGERSFIVAFGYENLADLLRKEHRLDEASAMIKKALDIYAYVLGPHHGTIAFARTNFALIEADSGHRAEAEQLLDSSVALAKEVFGDHARQVGFPAQNAARLRAQRGELEAAARAYETALDVLARNDPPSSRSVNGTRIEYAAVLVGLGRVAEARAALEQAEANLPRTGGMNDVPLLLTRAQLDYARRDARASQARIDEALALLDHERSPPDMLLVRIVTVAARCEPDRAHAEALLARLGARGLLAAPEARVPDIEYQARLAFAAGRLQLLVDHPDEASAWLERAVAQREALDDPHSVWLAEARDALAEAHRRSASAAPKR